MTSSPDLIRELKSSRPAAPAALRARVREISASHAQGAGSRPRTTWRLPVRRGGLIALPAAVALALASAGAIGLSRSDVSPETLRERGAGTSSTLAAPDQAERQPAWESLDAATDPAAKALSGTPGRQGSTIGPTDDRAARVSAVLTVEVEDADAVSRAAQDALDLTRSLGGHVVSAAVATGEEGSASLTVRIPVTKIQQAIVGLSGLGRIVSQQVSIDDLQASLDALERRERSVRAQLALIGARLESESLDAETRARLETRRKNLRAELRQLRGGIASTNAEARMATIQLGVVTPGAQGVVPVPSRLGRAIDEALNVLAWEAVIALALLIVMAPFALVALATIAGRRFYRRREEERLLAT